MLSLTARTCVNGIRSLMSGPIEFVAGDVDKKIEGASLPLRLTTDLNSPQQAIITRTSPSCCSCAAMPPSTGASSSVMIDDPPSADSLSCAMLTKISG